MSNENQNKFTPTFERPDEKTRRPVDDMAAYFAYWNAKELQRRRNEQQEERSLSVYERARRKYPGSW
jgi:hypothetical protein